METLDFSPEHKAVLDRHEAAIRELSALENNKYGRSEKPLRMHVLFMAAIDVSDATVDGAEIDVRKRNGLISKPSEIFEAADAAADYFTLTDYYTDIGYKPNAREQQRVSDLAAEALVELSDVVWNSFQIYLTNDTYGQEVMQPILAQFSPGDLELLVNVAIHKFSKRYKGEGGKNISQENAEIRKELIDDPGDERIFGFLRQNRQAIVGMLRASREVFVSIAQREGVDKDIFGVSIVLTQAYLDSKLQLFTNTVLSDGTGNGTSV